MDAKKILTTQTLEGTQPNENRITTDVIRVAYFRRDMTKDKISEKDDSFPHPKITSTDFSKRYHITEVKRLRFILCLQHTRSFNNYSASLNQMK